MTVHEMSIGHQIRKKYWFTWMEITHYKNEVLPVHVLNTCILMQNRFDNLTVKVVFKDILTRNKNELSANTLS